MEEGAEEKVKEGGEEKRREGRGRRALEGTVREGNGDRGKVEGTKPDKKCGRDAAKKETEKERQMKAGMMRLGDG